MAQTWKLLKFYSQKYILAIKIYKNGLALSTIQDIEGTQAKVLVAFLWRVLKLYGPIPRPSGLWWISSCMTITSFLCYKLLCFNVFILFTWVFCPHMCLYTTWHAWCTKETKRGHWIPSRTGVSDHPHHEGARNWTLAARAASVNGWATRGVDCYTFCSEKGEHVEFENFDYQARKEALLRIFWPKWLRKYSYDNGGLGKPHLAECFGSLTEDVSKRCFRSGRPVVVRIKWK